MIDSTNYVALELVRAAPDATITLEQASSSLPCGRSRRLDHLVLRPEATDPVESTIYGGLGAGAGSASVVLPAGCALERPQPGHRLRSVALVETAPEPRRRHRHQPTHHAAEHERAQPRPPAPAVAHPITSRCAMKPAISRPIACTPVDAAPPADAAITTAGTTYAQAAPAAAIQAVAGAR